MSNSPRILIVGGIPGSVCAPVDERRDRLGDLPRDKELLVFCQVGLRGYLGARILVQHGFKVRNLSGGYRRYAMWKGTHSAALACEPAMASEDGKQARTPKGTTACA